MKWGEPPARAWTRVTGHAAKCATPGSDTVTVPAMPLPPQLSDAQRQEALAKAAAVRRQRAELKDRLKIGDLTLADVLDISADDDVVGGTKVLAVLESLPRIGKVTARRLMEELDISETRRLRGLGVKQREALLARLS